jgi:polysaccharide pyruvyl transferase WcaK-like protein
MKVFVFGWYGQGNIGDEVFKISFQQLWPEADLTFGNSLPSDINVRYDALWVGGGSFLDQPVAGIDAVTIPIFFIGVGVSASVPDGNRRALERAKLVVARDSRSASCTPCGANTMLASDLVFARTDLKPLRLEKTGQVTLILNDFLTPAGGAVPDWKSLSYYWFLQEFSKIMDRLSLSGPRIRLVPMCTNARIDDRRIAAALQGRSACPHKYDWVLEPVSELELRTEISRSDLVITQRFHGLVYSVLEQTRCLTLGMHDKFSSLAGDLGLVCLDYYGLTDTRFKDALDQVMQASTDHSSYLDSAKASWEKARDAVRSLWPS